MTQALDVQVLRLPLQVAQVVGLDQLRIVVAALIARCAWHEFLVEDQGRPLQGLRTVNDEVLKSVEGGHSRVVVEFPLARGIGRGRKVTEITHIVCSHKSHEAFQSIRPICFLF